MKRALLILLALGCTRAPETPKDVDDTVDSVDTDDTVDTIDTVDTVDTVDTDDTVPVETGDSGEPEPEVTFRQWATSGRAAVEDLDAGVSGDIWMLSSDVSTPTTSQMQRLAAGQTVWTHDVSAFVSELAVLPDERTVFSRGTNTDRISLDQLTADGSTVSSFATVQPWSDATIYTGGLDASDDGVLSMVTGELGFGDHRVEITRFDHAGAESWSTEVVQGQTPIQTAGVAWLGEQVAFGLASSGGLFGTPRDGSANVWVGMLDAAGDLAWTDAITGPGVQTIGGVATDGTDLYVCGASDDPIQPGWTPRNWDIFVRAYAPDGTIRWTSQLGSARIDSCLDLQVLDGRVYASGVWEATASADSSYGLLAELTTNTGRVVRTLQLPQNNPGLTYAVAVEVTPVELTIGGFTTGNFPGHTSSGAVDAWLATYR